MRKKTDIFLEAAVDFILTEVTGDPQSHNTQLRWTIRNALASSQNVVVEDESLDFTLLIGLVIELGESTFTTRRFAWTPFNHQICERLTPHQIAAKLGNLGINLHIGQLLLTPIAHTRVFAQQNGDLLAFQCQHVGSSDT